jgi:hypothetical protein
MNKVLKYISVAAMTVMMTACMDLDPKDQLSDGNLWSKASDFQQFTNQMYGWTASFSVTVYDGVHSDKRSDLIADKGSVNLYANGTNTVPTSDSNYTDGYTHIRNCNLLLEKAAGYADQESITQAVGEAYFFRAYSYFEMLRLYGDLIIVTRTIDTDSEELYATRNNRTEVMDLIISDLHNAVDHLKDFKSVDAGRISREGALAFLSRVALYEGTWQKYHNENTTKANEYLSEAATAAREVIDGGQFKLFYNSVLAETSQKYMFILEDVAKSNAVGLTKSDNTEYIFSRRYNDSDCRQGKNLTVECLNNAQIISRKMAQMYLCSDGLPIEKSPKFQGYEKMNSEWQNRDNRMRYNMSMPGDTFYNGTASATARKNWDDTDNGSVFTPTACTRYYAQKWACEREVTSTYESYDFPIIRYAEVLLNYAEAVYERDGKISDEDLNRSLNLTRRRVNTEMPALTNAFVTANGLDMREEIRRERTVEFFNEGFRRDDLCRWKTAETEMPGRFLGVKWTGEFVTKGGSLGYSLDEDGCIIYEDNRQFSQKNYLYPLPSEQLQLNPHLNQNPGW